MPHTLDAGIPGIGVKDGDEIGSSRVRRNDHALHRACAIMAMERHVIDLLLLVIRMSIHLHVNRPVHPGPLSCLEVIRHQEAAIQRLNSTHPRQVQALKIPKVLVRVCDLRHDVPFFKLPVRWPVWMNSHAQACSVHFGIRFQAWGGTSPA